MNEDAQVVAAELSLNKAMVLPGADEHELEDIVHEHARLVYRVTYSLLRNHHDAEDAAQETFLRVLRYKQKLPSVRDRKAWLVRVAWRVALDRKTKVAEISADDIGEWPVPVQLPSMPAEDEVLAQQLSETLRRVIAGLAPKLRDPLLLSTIEELSAAEIAHALEINEAAVRSRIFRARQILKERLANVLGKDYGTRR